MGIFDFFQDGMSADAVVNQRRSLFEIKAAPVKETMGALETFRALRAEAQNNGLQEMTLDEINAEINQARKER